MQSNSNGDMNINLMVDIIKNSPKEEIFPIKGDEIYEMVLGITGDAFNSIVESEPIIANQIVRDFFALGCFDNERKLQYKQIDAASKKCYQLARSTTNIKIKGELIKGVFDLFLTFDRYNCERDFTNLIYTVKDDTEGLMIAEILAPFSSAIVDKSRLIWDKVNPALRQCLQENASMILPNLERQ
jgi:hypothetical protein